MKKLIFSLFVISLAFLVPKHSTAQQKALFVNDNGVFADNTDTVLTALTAAGIDYDVFSTRDSLRSPTFAEMRLYQFVIWYCSTDGVGNYLWNGNDTDNNELITILQSGGRLWLMGTDFLYDRYGGAPLSFVQGDFVFDILGISEYNAQSYGDDGGLGVPELDPIALPGNNLPLDTLRWTFPTAWWVDGCTPAQKAVSVYNMGPATYPLQGLSSAVWNYHNYFEGEKELTFLFDPALIDTYQNRVSLFKWAYYTLFLPPPPGIGELPLTKETMIIGKSLATDKIECKVPASVSSNFSILISDLNGKQMYSRSSESHDFFSIDISSFSPGMYVLTISDSRMRYYQKFVVGR